MCNVGELHRLNRYFRPRPHGKPDKDAYFAAGTGVAAAPLVPRAGEVGAPPIARLIRFDLKAIELGRSVTRASLAPDVSEIIGIVRR
jgi:hypothetical protein